MSVYFYYWSSDTFFQHRVGETKNEYVILVGNMENVLLEDREGEGKMTLRLKNRS
jgi:hypothetical protein